MTEGSGNDKKETGMTRRGTQELQSDGRENSRGKNINDEEKLFRFFKRMIKVKKRRKEIRIKKEGGILLPPSFGYL